MSEYFIVNGLAGEKKLEGEIKVGGAKNSALKAMCASILFSTPVTLENIPNTRDLYTLRDIMSLLGINIEWEHTLEKTHDIRPKTMIIDSRKTSSTFIDPKLAGGMRASVVLTGPMLARFGRVSFPAPGGCVIGARPIDLFLEGYEKMGAKVILEKDIYNILAPEGLIGTKIRFKKISVGGTETLMMAATLARGKTILQNCAKEPEIVNVAKWLISNGARIKGVGTSTITIYGNGSTPQKLKLFKQKKAYRAIPDRIQAGSYLILGALCAKDMTLSDCEPTHLSSLIRLLKNSGVPITVKRSKVGKMGTGKISIRNNNKPNSTFRAFDIITKEYPGFPTDLQSPMVTYLTQVKGKSRVFESIFEGRFKYVEDLSKLGAKIEILGDREIVVDGPTSLRASSPHTDLTTHDIRAGFAVILGAIVASGKSKISNVHLVDRGYEEIEKVLGGLGVSIERVL